MRARVSGYRVLACIVTCAVVFAIGPVQWLPGPNAMAALAGQSPPAPEQPQPARLTPEQLRQLVAPIALYPDALVAQILAASAYPTQIVEADRFLQENPSLKGAALGAEVDKQDWDPSVKALTQFLTGQGANQPGGARSYIVDGKMTGGFAFLAFPAEYRSSGVMTFIVDQGGVVYEKDLGPRTAEIAKTPTQYSRDATWRKAD